MPLATLRFLIGPCADFPFHINGDMSERVMSIIESMVPASEVYSIDEAFADLTGIPGDLTAFGRRIGQPFTNVLAFLWA